MIQSAPVGGFMEHDLPPELLQVGWRKFWSKRENRPYFWNKLTGESLWEMPEIKPPQVSSLMSSQASQSWKYQNYLPHSLTH